MVFPKLLRPATSMICSLCFLTIVLVLCPNSFAQGSVPDDIYWNDSFFLSGLDLTGHSWQTALVVYDGDLIVGGDFERVDGLEAYNMAGWNGSNWYPFGKLEDGLIYDPDANTVSDFEIYNGELYVAAVTGNGVGEILKRDGDTWVTVGSNMRASALAVYDGKLVAGGEFFDAEGTSVNNIAVWDGVVWDSLGSGIPGGEYYFTRITDMVVYNNKLIVAGEFTEAGGIPCNNIAQWDGVAWDSVGSGIIGDSYHYAEVNCLATFANELYVGGRFSDSAGNVSNNLAIWDGLVWQPFPCNLQDSIEIYAMVEYNSQLIVAGYVHSDIIYPNIFSYDGATCTPFPVWPDGVVSGLAVYNSDLVAMGEYSAVGDIVANGIALWDGSSWSRISSRQGQGVPVVNNYGPLVMTGSNGKLIVAGGFAGAGDVVSQNLISWDGDQWEAVGVGADTAITMMYESSYGFVVGGSINDYYDQIGPYETYPLLMIYDDMSDIRTSLFDVAQISYDTSGLLPPYYCRVTGVCEYDGELVVAFNRSVELNGVPLSNLAKWDGLTWSPFNSQPFPGVTSMTVYDTLLVAIGFDDSVDPPLSLIAVWDGSDWTGWAYVLGYANISSIAIYDGDLVVGGNFNSGNSNLFGRIARFDSDQQDWFPLGDGLGGDSDRVFDLAVYNGRLIAAGTFSQASGVDAMRVAAWDGVSWSALGSGVAAKDDGMALAVYGDNLVVCGEFHAAGGKASSGIAFWNEGTGDCCLGDRGNANGDPEDKVNVTDITYLINWLFGVPSGTPPSCLAEANTNGDPEEKVNITDITYLIQYLFGVPTGPAPASCP